MTHLSRRQFLKATAASAAATLLAPFIDRARRVLAEVPQPQHFVYVAKNGNAASNVGRALQLAGGIQQYVGHDDAVVLKPNGQWPLQGYTHTLSLKALIDAILNRPGGFGGEIIIAEHVHRNATETLAGEYCWNMSTGYNRTNNWSVMNYFDLVSDYHQRGIPNVNAIPLYDSGIGNFVPTGGPGSLPAGKHGWARTTYTTQVDHRKASLSRAILRSPYSGNLIDLKYGVWRNGSYTSQPVRLIFLPTLNNHSSFGIEDYAGPTSALKCHLGISEFTGDGDYSLHSVGYNDNRPDQAGETIGHLITQVITPTFYLTCAEYTGYRGRTDSTAAHTKIVGLCADPVTLDYWMCKYVMYPCATSQTFMNPDNNNHLRQGLLACNGKGVGTLDETDMLVTISDLNTDKRFFMPAIAR